MVCAMHTSGKSASAVVFVEQENVSMAGGEVRQVDGGR